MKILVTGGAGFIASHIVDAYIALGHSVDIVDDFSTGKPENVNPDATFFEMDISRADEISRLIADAGYDAISHHAAQLDVRKSVADPLFDARVNIMGSLAILEAAVQSGVKKVIFASSGGTVYGEQERFPADESHPLQPVSPYGVAKLSVENYLHYYHVVKRLPYIALRYANVYGPRQNPHGEAGVVAIFANRMLAGQQPFINGDGKQTRDYVYVGDVVRANVLALDHAGTGAFNVGTATETDVNALFALINRELKAGFDALHAASKAGEQRRSVLDYDRIHRQMGWSPKVTLEEGMALTLEWFRSNQKNG